MKTIYWILITDIYRLNYNRIPAVLFPTKEKREAYIEWYSPTSYRVFQYDIEEEYAELDLVEWRPLPYPNL